MAHCSKPPFIFVDKNKYIDVCNNCHIQQAIVTTMKAIYIILCKSDHSIHQVLASFDKFMKMIIIKLINPCCMYVETLLEFIYRHIANTLSKVGIALENLPSSRHQIYHWKALSHGLNNNMTGTSTPRSFHINCTVLLPKS